MNEHDIVTPWDVLIRYDPERLCAAAPDLLHAVAAFIWLGDYLHKIKDNPTVFREFYENSLIEARAAYEKATGTKP